MIPRFGLAPTSLSTSSCRWLHEEAWDDAQISAFSEARRAAETGLYRAVPYVKARRGHVAPQVVGRWLLQLEGDAEPAAAVEAQMLASQFKAVTLLVSPLKLGAWTEARAQAALTLLVSAVLLLAEADVLRVAPLSERVGEELRGLGLGAVSEIWTPFSALARLVTPRAGLRLPVVTLTPHEWWQTPQGAEARQTLTYLEKRLKHAAEQAEAASQRRPRGFAQRLARFLKGR